MDFEPRSGQHAIVEAVLGLTLQASFTPAQIEDLVARHDEWKQLLPRLTSGQGFTFDLNGQQFQFPMGSAAGVMFDRVKPNGDLEWRLRVQGDTIFVNCLSYAGWSKVWDQAADLFRRSMSGLGGVPVKGALLQYIDVFDWGGPVDEYNISNLMNFDSGAVPKTLLGRGPFWHLHEGWFRAEKTLPPGRLLERFHADAVQEPNGRASVKFDSQSSVEMADVVPADDKTVASLFDTLHSLHKSLLGQFITPRIADRIGLDA